MYNCINVAIKYLEKKYKKNYAQLITSRVEMEDKIVVILIGQYYYGIPAKKELYYKMIEFGLIPCEDESI
jgi:hypothetical protein